MFVRKLKNRSGSHSVQVIQKVRGKYKVIKTVGCATTQHQTEALVHLAKQEIEKLVQQPSLFGSEADASVEKVFASLQNAHIRTVGPEITFGRIYDYIGFGAISEPMFRHLVISRIAFPLSKLKTVDYLYRYQGKRLDIDAVYRFLDRLNSQLKPEVEQIAFAHTQRVLKGNVSVVFYDMTTLYFEASDEDDLRKTGFNKDGKHQCPQIYIGLLVGLGGYAVGYDIFEGNTYEGHTLIPFLDKLSSKFKLGKPVVVADSGLLSRSNIAALEENGYEYILGARIKNESETVKSRILAADLTDGMTCSFSKGQSQRLIINHSKARARKDAYNRSRGLKRLEEKVKRGRLTKANINNRGYNKYLRLEGDVTVRIDYEKYSWDASWDGLKGYVTNTKLANAQVVENYGNLWHVERAFRMSKTDLRIRPIYHRLRHRIEAHICIAFTAYCVYKELERVLKLEQSTLSLKKAADVTHNMYQITYTLPDSKHIKYRLLQMDEEQLELYEITNKYF